MKIAYKPLATCVLIPLGLTAAVLTPLELTDTATQKKMYGWAMTILIISNEEIKNILAKKQKRGFILLLSGISGASLLGNMLAAKEVIKTGSGASATSQWQDTIRADQDFWCCFIL